MQATKIIIDEIKAYSTVAAHESLEGFELSSSFAQKSRLDEATQNRSSTAVRANGTGMPLAKVEMVQLRPIPTSKFNNGPEYTAPNAVANFPFFARAVSAT